MVYLWTIIRSETKAGGSNLEDHAGCRERVPDEVTYHNRDLYNEQVNVQGRVYFLSISPVIPVFLPQSAVLTQVGNTCRQS